MKRLLSSQEASNAIINGLVALGKIPSEGLYKVTYVMRKGAQAPTIEELRSTVEGVLTVFIYDSEETIP